MKYYNFQNPVRKEGNKIRYFPLLICALVIVISNEVLSYFDRVPELFRYGDEIFHFSVSLISILSQLSASIIAGVIFYYCIEFTSYKKNMGRIMDIRKDLMCIEEAHMEVLLHLDEFTGLGYVMLDKRNVSIKDIAIFLTKLENLKDNKERFYEDVAEILGNFINIEKYFNDYKRSMDRLEKYNSFVFIRDYEEKVYELNRLYDNLKYYFEKFINPEIDEDESYFLRKLSSNYCDFVYATSELYYEANSLIGILNNKDIIGFLKISG